MQAGLVGEAARDCTNDLPGTIVAWRDQLPLVTVLEGDCRHWFDKIPDGSIDLIVTDPPYGIHWQSKRPTKKERFPVMAEDEEIEAVCKLLEEVAPEFHRVLRADAHLYVFCRGTLAGPIASCFMPFFEWRDLIVWAKGRGIGDRTGRRYVSAYEGLLFLTKGNRRLEGHPEDLMWAGRTGKKGQLHGAQKALLGLTRVIEASSWPGEVVLDPFAGSGSTGAACIVGCEPTRKSILIEKDPKVVIKACERLKWYGELGRELPRRMKDEESPI